MAGDPRSTDRRRARRLARQRRRSGIRSIARDTTGRQSTSRLNGRGIWWLRLSIR
ncbi:hypothetical protein BN903_310 [Halorubrum sp. AJ67]|nr:hypothetical protein BN903_310 [Halorubrum sp. AJ67]